MRKLLELDNLSVTFAGVDGDTEVLRQVSYGLRQGESLALVGESGCGKSMSALAILGLLPPGGRVSAGRIELRGSGDLLSLRPGERRSLLGRRIGMVFQDAGNALNPVLTLGSQLSESLRLHRGLGRREAMERGAELLALVSMPDPRSRLRSYPHELSGGQQQRALLALALASEPEILLADEPTTGLDVTIQAQILRLLARLRVDLGLSLLLITHDLGVVAGLCDRVVVMYAGEVVEIAPVRELFGNPQHPYTRALLAACPRLGDGGGEKRVVGIPGRVPEMRSLPTGCCFEPRCKDAMSECSATRPKLLERGSDRACRCLLYQDPAERNGS